MNTRNKIPGNIVSAYWLWIAALLTACVCLWGQSRYCFLHPGRDMVTYWSYYQEFFKVHPDNRTLMLFRGPVTPLFFGFLFDFLGSIGVQTVLSVLYVLCLLAVFAIGFTLSVWVGFLALILVGADIQYYYWFFSVGSESPQSFLLVLWMTYAFFTFRKTSARYWVLHAVIVWLLILNRPGNQVMGLCVLFPLLNFRIASKRRLVLSLVFLLTYGVCHVAYCYHNYVRVGSFQVSTLGNAHMPFYRIYLQDGLIDPENGPKSRELADLVDEKLLPLDVFKQYRIDSNIFFTMPSQRMYNHLIQAVAEVYGWDHQWLILRQAAMETLFRHPVEFFLTYIDHLRDVFYVRGNGRFDLSRYSRLRPDRRAFLRQRYARYGEWGLPIPSEGDLLPRQKEHAPANEGEDYTERTFFNAKKQQVEWTVPRQHCSYHWGEIFDIYAIKFPFTFVFICIGGAGAVLSFVNQRRYENLAMIGIFCVSWTTLAATLMATVQFPFRFPFDTVFILFGCFGVYTFTSYHKLSVTQCE